MLGSTHGLPVGIPRLCKTDRGLGNAVHLLAIPEESTSLHVSKSTETFFCECIVSDNGLANIPSTALAA